jgi:pSer/pThr/pTyr-binding forkhead associated (FHA) protein
MSASTEQHPDPPRRAARDVIEAVLENMRRNLEPLKYSTLVPSRYVVYLHPDEFSRLEDIVPILQSETSRALDEELAKLNRQPLVRRAASRVLGAAPPVQNPSAAWQIEILADPDGELSAGDILIHSELVLPKRDEPGAGQRTRRIATVHVGQRTTTREKVVTETRPATPRVAARLTYQDESGPHSYDVTGESTTVGRGGPAYRVDVRINASADVSREHLVIRRDPQSGSFFIADLSMLGTTVNGQPVPKGYTEVSGTRERNGTEVPLPDGARIGLADTVYLDFRLVSG